MVGYEPDEYWSNLLADEATARTVGYANLPVSFNVHAHRAGRRAVDRALARTGFDPAGASVLDVGAGAGLWIDYWLSRGANVVAVDLTNASVEALRMRFPGVRVERADIAGELPDVGPVDVISAMNVLLHVTDDAAFARALHNLAAALQCDGLLVALEPVLVRGWHGPSFAGASATARPLAQWRNALAAVGLEIVELLPATLLLASAVDTKSPRTLRALWLYWNALSKAIGLGERRGDVVGRVLGVMDRLLVELVRPGWSGKVLVARKIAS
jgi:SAM-dependent methyltransferase